MYTSQTKAHRKSALVVILHDLLALRKILKGNMGAMRTVTALIFNPYLGIAISIMTVD